MKRSECRKEAASEESDRCTRTCGGPGAHAVEGKQGEEEEDSKLVCTDAGEDCKEAGVRGHGRNDAVDTYQPGRC